MITCSYCKFENIEGTYFCEECGSPLLAAGTSVATHKLADNAADAQIMATWGTAYLKMGMEIIMRFQESRESITLPEKGDIMFGRNDDRNEVNPDIDLTRYNGIENGVSRNHAIIKRSEDKVMLFDLESANGTYLNGQRVLPNQPRILRDGDEIRFGKLAARIYFK